MTKKLKHDIIILQNGDDIIRYNNKFYKRWKIINDLKKFHYKVKRKKLDLKKSIKLMNKTLSKKEKI